MNFRKDVENLTEAYKQINEVSWGGPTIGSSVPPRPKFQSRPQVSGAVNWGAATDAAYAKKDKAQRIQQATKEAEKATERYDSLVNSMTNEFGSRSDMAGKTREEIERALRNAHPDMESLEKLQNQLNKTGQRAAMHDAGLKNIKKTMADKAAAEVAQAQQQLADQGFKMPSSPTTSPNVLDTIKQYATDNPGKTALAGVGAGLVAAKLLSKKKKDDDDKQV